MQRVLAALTTAMLAATFACSSGDGGREDNAVDDGEADGSHDPPGEQTNDPPACDATYSGFVGSPDRVTTTEGDESGRNESQPAMAEIGSWVYQLQGYPQDGVEELAAAPQPLAVIDLARDASDDYFTADDVAELCASGKVVLAYFEIGSIEDFRPEYPDLPQDLVLNRWPDWPEEYFVRYWEPAWWDSVIRPRIDAALAAGFDGVYLDTPLAYENIDLSLVEGEDRDTLAAKMADLIVRISEYGKSHEPNFLVFPQNSPELREQPGYVEAIDGLGVEELFFAADDETSDQPCEQDWCEENLAHVRALRDAGKLILAVDYASEPGNVDTACRRYAEEGFAGYVTTRALDEISPACPGTA